MVGFTVVTGFLVAVGFGVVGFDGIVVGFGGIVVGFDGIVLGFLVLASELIV